MKRGQLGTVIVIVLVVAAVGAFMIFSGNKAGKAIALPGGTIPICGNGKLETGEQCEPPGAPSTKCSKIILPDGRCDYPVCLNNCSCPIGKSCSGSTAISGTSSYTIVPGTSYCRASTAPGCYDYSTGTSTGHVCSGTYGGCSVTYGCARTGELMESRSPPGCS